MGQQTRPKEIMRSTILVLSLAIIYASASNMAEDHIIPEESLFALDDDLSEAQQKVNEMTAAGKSDKDCRKLVTETRKDIETNVNTCQKTMDALPNGKECPSRGQKGVKTATEAKDKADKHYKYTVTEVTKASSASVKFGSRTFSSLTEGKCESFYSSTSYTTAEATYKAAVTARTKAKGAAEQADKELKAAIEAAAKAKKECECQCKRAKLTAAVNAAQCVAAKKCNGKEPLNFVSASQTWAMSGHNAVTYGPKQAIDNSGNTRNGMKGPGAWTGDFGKLVELRQLKVDWEACQCNNKNSVAIQTSTDGKTWKNCGYWGGFHQWGKHGARTHDVEKHGCSGKARYVRYTTTGNMGAGQWMSMWSASAEGCK